MQPHIKLSEQNTCRYAILPGDPKRVDRIGENLKELEDLGQNREYRSIRGLYKGVPILCVSTGIGGPSTAIAVEELKAIGVDTIVRIGSCGSLNSSLELGTLVLVQAAIREDGASNSYISTAYPAVSDYTVLNVAEKIAHKMCIPSITGIVRSHDGLYSGKQPTASEYWSNYGVLASDMETATLLTVASLRGIRAMSILNNIVLWGEDVKEGINSYSDNHSIEMIGEHNSIILALETIAKVNKI